jgi:predicted phosphodiesterase
MRYLILSDIHSNWEALEASLAAVEGRYDKAVCCGDIVGYGADPNRAVEWVRVNAVAVVRGNHDKACCGIDDAESFNAVARAAALWTRNQLTLENLNYLRQLPAGPVQVEVPGSQKDFQVVHGSLSDEDEYMMVPREAAEEFANLPLQVTFFGHTHVQGGFVSRAGVAKALRPSYEAGISTRTLEIEESEKYMLNPGSIGQPRDGDSRAALVIYAPGEGPSEGIVEYWRIPYDIAAAQERITAAGLPEVLAYRLRLGR